LQYRLSQQHLLLLVVEGQKMVVVKLVLLHLVLDQVVQTEVETHQIACHHELHGNNSTLGMEYLENGNA
jgi:hypothetical protein